MINAFSSNEAMDVKIIGRSVLVRAEDPAELIILTEKRRLTLLLSPEQGPSRTAIIRGKDTQPPYPDTDAAGGTQALPYERAITDLVVSLAKDSLPGREGGGTEALPLASHRAGRGGGVATFFRSALHCKKLRLSRPWRLRRACSLIPPRRWQWEWSAWS